MKEIHEIDVELFVKGLFPALASPGLERPQDRLEPILNVSMIFWILFFSASGSPWNASGSSTLPSTPFGAKVNPPGVWSRAMPLLCASSVSDLSDS